MMIQVESPRVFLWCVYPRLGNCELVTGFVLDLFGLWIWRCMCGSEGWISGDYFTSFSG